MRARGIVHFAVLLEHWREFVRGTSNIDMWEELEQMSLQLHTIEFAGLIGGAELIPVTVFADVAFDHENLGLGDVANVNDVPQCLPTTLARLSREHPTKKPLPGSD